MQQPVEPQLPVEEAVERPRLGWHHKLGRLIFIIVCFEVGAFLLVFPWLEHWDANWVAGLAPWLRTIWDSPYFRGALSGLGVVNIYISVAEMFRFRRPPAGKLKVSTL